MSRTGARAVVAGGGILGTWHALELVEAGFTVEHLEAEAAPNGASVRNFGLVWVSGRRSGAELDAALRARRRWEDIGAAVPGVGFRPAGSLTVACTADEREVMDAFARHPDAAPRSVSVLEPDEVRARNPAVQGDIHGALYCAQDAVVEPRRRPRGAPRSFDGAGAGPLPLSPRLPHRGGRTKRPGGQVGHPVGGGPRGRRHGCRPTISSPGPTRRCHGCGASGCRCSRRLRSPPG